MERYLRRFLKPLLAASGYRTSQVFGDLVYQMTYRLGDYPRRFDPYLKSAVYGERLAAANPSFEQPLTTRNGERPVFRFPKFVETIRSNKYLEERNQRLVALKRVAFPAILLARCVLRQTC